MASPNRNKLIESAITNLKSPSVWGKIVGVAMTILLLLQTYYDIRSDVRDAQEEAKEAQKEVGQTEEEILSKGKLSEQTTAEAITELQEKMQFIYEEGALLKDQVDDLELENKRLKARLDRYRDLSGIPPEEMPEEDLRDLAALLLPFLSREPDPSGVGGGGVGMSGDAVSIELEGGSGDAVETETASASKKAAGKKEKYVDESGNLKFEKEPAKAF